MDLDGNIIGKVTSGTQSPSSGKSIALAMIKEMSLKWVESCLFKFVASIKSENC